MTQHWEPETRPEVKARFRSFTAQWGGSFLPSGSEHLQEAPTRQDCGMLGFPCQECSANLRLLQLHLRGWLSDLEDSSQGHPTPNTVKEFSVWPQIPVTELSRASRAGLRLAPHSHRPHPHLLCSDHPASLGSPSTGSPCCLLGWQPPPLTRPATLSLQVFPWSSLIDSYKNSSSSPLPVPNPGSVCPRCLVLPAWPCVKCSTNVISGNHHHNP